MNVMSKGIRGYFSYPVSLVREYYDNGKTLTCCIPNVNKGKETNTQDFTFKGMDSILYWVKD